MQNLSVDQTVVYRRPKPGTKTGRVWDIADELTRVKGRPAKRREENKKKREKRRARRAARGGGGGLYVTPDAAKKRDVTKRFRNI